MCVCLGPGRYTCLSNIGRIAVFLVDQTAIFALETWKKNVNARVMQQAEGLMDCPGLIDFLKS